MTESWYDRWQDIKDDIWEEAMEDTRDEMGYSEGEYIDDWETFIDNVKDNFSILRDREYDDFQSEMSNIADSQYRDYLESKEWNKKRFQVFERDRFICRKCGKRAKEVHHQNYDFLHTDKEIDYCVSLCYKCHRVTHRGVPK